MTTLLTLYAARNFGKLVGLECPEPLANLYKPAFFRATWVTTALDAGFWSAMHIKRKPWRDFCSILFTLYYLLCAEQADEKVRKIRSVVTVDHLRVSWNKPNTPYLNIFMRLMRPRLMRYQPRAIRLPRPSTSSYRDPVHGWLYYDGPISALKQQTKVVLYFPGGGFVAMDPRTHDDPLMAWAGKTGLPVLSLDYRKAPEYPYPYALNECYDVYKSIIQTNGRCLGLSGNTQPSIIISGDSAGGNLAAAVTIMLLESASTDTRRLPEEAALPSPDGLVLLYPSLDVNIGNWMTDEQMSLIRDRGMRKTNRRILSRKNSEYRRTDPGTPHLMDDEGEADAEDEEFEEADKAPSPTSSPSTLRKVSDTPPSGAHPQSQDNGSPSGKLSKTSTTTKISSRTHPRTTLTRTRIAVPSLISYVSDRVLTPELLRAMIILYIGPHARPHFATDFLLSPVLAPEALLARFPKTYFLTGERDPLVDDTVIMAGRIRAAKRAAWESREELGVLTKEEKRRGWRDTDVVSVKLLEGVSHGFLQMCGIFPEAWDYVYTVGKWYEELFAAVDQRLRADALGTGRQSSRSSRTKHGTSGSILSNGNGNASGRGRRHHQRTGTASSADDDADSPLEIGSSSTRNGRGGKPPKPLTLSSSSTTTTTANGRPREEDLSSPQSRSRPTTPGYDHEHDEGGGLGRRKKSLVSLDDHDDLVERRMAGLVGGLMRVGGAEQ